MNATRKFYFYSMAVIYLVYFFTLIGIISYIPEYIEKWHYIVQIFLCTFLMYRYNPFRKEYKFDNDDAKMIFGACLLLLLNLISSVIYVNFKEYENIFQLISSVIYVNFKEYENIF